MMDVEPEVDQMDAAIQVNPESGYRDEETALDLHEFRAPESTSIRRQFGEAGVCSIVNCKNGKRIVLSRDVMDWLKNPEELQLAIGNMELGFGYGQYVPTDWKTFFVKRSGPKGILYAGKLVNEVTEKLGLDFSNRTTLTFHKAEYKKYRDTFIVSIKIDK